MSKLCPAFRARGSKFLPMAATTALASWRGDADILQHAGQGVAAHPASRCGFPRPDWDWHCRHCRRWRVLRLAGADQLHEQRIGQRGTARRHHGPRDRHGAHRHPGDGARHQRGQAGGNQRPAPSVVASAAPAPLRRGASVCPGCARSDRGRCGRGCRDSNLLRCSVETWPAASPPTCARPSSQPRRPAHPRRATDGHITVILS